MSFTTNLNLFKNDNLLTNINEFDIEKSLNENWDKIDEYIGNIRNQAKWKDLTLNNKWVNLGTPYLNTQYQNIFGHIFFRGTVRNTSDADTLILTLPEEIRPKGYIYAIANYCDAMGSFRIGPDGSFAVVNYNGGQAWVDLSCVHFGIDEGVATESEAIQMFALQRLRIANVETSLEDAVNAIIEYEKINKKFVSPFIIAKLKDKSKAISVENLTVEMESEEA